MYGDQFGEFVCGYFNQAGEGGKKTEQAGVPLPPTRAFFFLSSHVFCTFPVWLKRDRNLCSTNSFFSWDILNCLVLASSQRATEPLFPNLCLVIQINLIHDSWESFLIDLFFFIFFQSKASPKAVCCQYIKNSLLLHSHNYRWGQKLPF